MLEGRTSDNDGLKWNLLQKRVQETKLVRAFRLFRDNQIEPILIKGWAAGIHYPKTRPRLSIDMDLAVSSTNFNEAERLAMESAGEGLAIDLHRELRHLDTLPWSDLFDNSTEIQVDGYPIRILRPEDHLRVLCIHWLTDGAVNKDRLWDVYHLVNGRSSQFDWQRFLDVTSPARRRWLVCTVGLASRYLKLDLAGTPLSEEADDLPGWLIQTVEKNWAVKNKHVPLEVAVFSPSDLGRQIGRLINPNPIGATIAMEGSFDAPTRLHYQAANFVKRVGPALRRVGTSLRQRLK
jgi:hypothetical protein